MLLLLLLPLLLLLLLRHEAEQARDSATALGTDLACSAVCGVRYDSIRLSIRRRYDARISITTGGLSDRPHHPSSLHRHAFACQPSPCVVDSFSCTLDLLVLPPIQFPTPMHFHSLTMLPPPNLPLWNHLSPSLPPSSWLLNRKKEKNTRVKPRPARPCTHADPTWTSLKHPVAITPPPKKKNSPPFFALLS